MKVREAALREAISFVGVTEKPLGSNRGKEIDVWNEQAGVPKGSYWCCSFMHAMFAKTGFKLPGGASVGLLLTAARQNGWIVTRPRRGDLVCFEFEGASDYADHIGQVIRVLALRWKGATFTGWILTVEGNTSEQSDPTGSQANGGCVSKRWRWLSKTPAMIVRVPGDVKK